MGKVLVMLAIGVLTCASAIAQSRADWVLGQWRGGEFWFPGVVQSRSGDMVTITYDDGTRETVPSKRVRPYTWNLGTRVECRWAGGKKWYSGQITSISADGTELNIKYDDGERERMATGGCRSR
ncbi:MAG: agenet domain-containing protein [Thermomonas sp.]